MVGEDFRRRSPCFFDASRFVALNDFAEVFVWQTLKRPRHVTEQIQGRLRFIDTMRSQKLPKQRRIAFRRQKGVLEHQG